MTADQTCQTHAHSLTRSLTDKSWSGEHRRWACVVRAEINCHIGRRKRSCVVKWMTGKEKERRKCAGKEDTHTHTQIKMMTVANMKWKKMTECGGKDNSRPGQEISKHKRREEKWRNLLLPTRKVGGDSLWSAVAAIQSKDSVKVKLHTHTHTHTHTRTQFIQCASKSRRLELMAWSESLMWPGQTTVVLNNALSAPNDEKVGGGGGSRIQTKHTDFGGDDQHRHHH